MSSRRRLLLSMLNAYKFLPYSYTYLYHSLVPQTISGKNVRNKAKFTKIYGNSEVVNQLVATSDVRPLTTTTTNGITFTNNNDGSITISGTASADFYQQITRDIPIPVQGHSWLIFSELIGDSSKYWLTDGWTGAIIDSGNAKIQTINTSYVVLRFNIKSGVQINQTIHPQLVDLTKQYPFDTPTTLTDNRVKNILAQGYIPYNTGEIKDMVIGNFSSEDSNNQPLGTLQLPALYKSSGIGTSKDSWEITNTSHIFTRNNFHYTFTGNESWTQWTYERAYTNVIASSVKIPSGTDYLANALLDNYQIYYQSNLTNEDKVFCVATNGNLIFRDTTNISNIQSIMAGHTIKYQLATPQVITIPRKHLAVVDLSKLTFGMSSSGKFYCNLTTNLPNAKIPTSQDSLANIYCDKYIVVNGYNASQHNTNMGIGINPNGYLYLRDDTITQASNIKGFLFYEAENEVADITDTFDIEAGGTINTNWFTWVENQQLKPTAISTTSGGITITNNNNGTFTNTSGTTSSLVYYAMYLSTDKVQPIQNHKYLLFTNATGINGTSGFTIGAFGNYIESGKNALLFTLSTINNTDTCVVRIASGTSINAQTFWANVVDLTVGFPNGDIPTDINDYRIQYILEHGYIPTDTNGTYTSETCEVLPDVDFSMKCK